jgi:hypothetical protein
MTFSRLHITVLLGAAVFVWCLLLLTQGTPVTKEHLAPFSSVVVFLVTIGLLFEHVLWHQRCFHGWFVQRPDLRGTWRVELRSDWIDPKTGRRIEPIEGFMAVTQTLSRLQMHLMTAESQSWLVAERVTTSPKNRGYRVVAVYTNEPDPHLRGNRSEIHYGALVLDTHGVTPSTPDRLSGEYWTDRGTKGTLTLSSRASTIYSRFQEARTGLGSREAVG